MFLHLNLDKRKKNVPATFSVSKLLPLPFIRGASNFSLLAARPLSQHPSLLARATVNLVGGRDAAVLGPLACRPHVLIGFQAVDGLLGDAEGAQVGEDAAQAAFIVVHVRRPGLERFVAESVRERGHAAGPVRGWLRGSDLWREHEVLVVTRERISGTCIGEKR